MGSRRRRWLNQSTHSRVANSTASELRQACAAARRLANHWQDDYPKAAACLREGRDELLTCWRYRSPR
jgi:transposase-like protein